MPPRLIVQISDDALDGHAEHRVRAPGRGLAKLPGVQVVEMPMEHRHLAWAVENADVLILHTIDPDLAAMVHGRRARGQVTTFEACDNYFDIQPWSRYSVGWLDRARQDQFWYLAAAVDAVQTSTEHLARLWSMRARRTLVFPNIIPPPSPLPPRQKRPLTLGWAGSTTHLADWLELAPTLTAWVRRTPGVQLAVMTDRLAQGWVTLPAEQYQFTPLGSHAEYQSFLRGLDLAVVPLGDSPFNRGRTDLKVWDLGAAGVVGLYEDREPYGGAVVPGETGFLYTSPQELTDFLDGLVQDPACLEPLRHAAYAATVRRAAVDGVAPRWKAYCELYGGTPGTLPEAIRHEAVADGLALRLPLGEVERTVAQAAQSPDAEAGPVREIARRHPHYAAAGRALARVLIRQGAPDAAVAALDALAASAATPRVLCDSAAAHAAAGDAAMARTLLQRAVALNPAYAGAWSGLVKLDPTLRERAARNQPCNALAALAAACDADSLEAALGEWLDRHGATAHDDEKPYFAAAWLQSIDRLELHDRPLLLRATEVFADSTGVWHRLGQACLAADDAEGAVAAWSEAARRERIARSFLIEFGQDPPERPLWGIAAYAKRHRRKG